MFKLWGIWRALKRGGGKEGGNEKHCMLQKEYGWEELETNKPNDQSLAYNAGLQWLENESGIRPNYTNGEAILKGHFHGVQLGRTLLRMAHVSRFKKLHLLLTTKSSVCTVL